MITSSQYINHQRRDYALYVMTSRAIPAITDGLKSGGRRVLWTARNGQKWKSASLAGATMPIHPHASPESAINTLAAPYGNNVPLFTGFGAFGTLLDPTAYGASRYTSVKVSKFSQDVLFADIDIIPMMDNYDGTEKEPTHFLPLVPVVLLNPSEGIAVGFATNILPRKLSDIIAAQINVLTNKPIEPLIPTATFIDNKSYTSVETEKGIAYYFLGDFEVKNATTIKITKFPYGQSHEKVISKLEDEFELGNIVDYDDNSKDTINIEVKFKKGYLSKTPKQTLLQNIGLWVRHIENLNVLDFTGQVILNTTPEQLVESFTKWRLEWYVTRYERLRDLLMIDIQQYKDILTAIRENVGGIAKQIQSRSELKEYLATINIVYIDYIADLQVYRFTENERIKIEQKLVEAQKLLDHYNDLLNNENKRKKIYISELQEILTKYNKGYYN